MRLEASRSPWLIVAALAVVVGLACYDSTAPIPARISGSYDLTTDLQSYTYSNVCQPTSSGMHCTDTTIAAGPSKLYGTITLGDTVPATTEHMTFAVTGAGLHQAGCAMNTAPCSETVVSYSGSATVGRSGLAFEAPLYGSVMVALTGHVVAGQIVGQVKWHTYLGCCARQYYSGTFVAKRQR